MVIILFMSECYRTFILILNHSIDYYIYYIRELTNICFLMITDTIIKEYIR